MLDSNIPKVISGELELKKMLDAIGSIVANKIRGNIFSGTLTPPLKPGTIEARERRDTPPSRSDSNPLYDTGELVDSIAHEVKV